ncbi:Ldh family oxidoreductase [Streptomyces sp. NPDC013455]|uniref:Ldh family oxidoreductase n=1 Tax=Streptomyces sp. NPDC013455 TaxID=3155605 RepID=UPI0033DFEC85
MLELSDVVLALGPDGGERVLLRGADLRVAEGETVLVTGLDAPARRSLTALLTGRLRPRYGTVRAARARTATLGARPRAGETLVLDAGDRPAGTGTGPALPNGPGAAVLVLGGPGWTSAPVPGDHRTLALQGGRFLAEPRRPAPPPAVRMTLDEVRRRTHRSLTEAGTGAATASLVADVLVDADRRGHASHGVALLPTYLRRIADGGIVAAAEPRLTPVTSTLASVDAGGGFGQPAADLAARWCAGTAAEHGLAAVAVHTNNHVGMLAAYRRPFQEHGVAGLLLNISAPSVAAPGARRPTLGSNAVCLVTPTPAEEPFCIDLATGVVAAGKIRDARHRGEPVPPGWLLDPEGTPTTDPAALDQGGSIPLFGDYKGLCITLIAEILAGGLAGGLVSPDVARQVTRTGEVMRCAQLFVGFSVRHFTDPAVRSDAPAAPAGLGALVTQLRDAVEAGHDTVPERPYFPDQLEETKAEHAEKQGLELPASIVTALGWDAS